MAPWSRWSAILALGAAATSASAAPDLGSAVRDCRALADPAARLACYDGAVDRAQPAAPAAVPAAASAEENFGREHQIEAEQQARQQQAARALDELEATVSRIDRRMDGLMTITLDNGQTWRQNRPDSMFRLKEGDRVKIQPGALNSFILSGPTNRSTRVSRVQ